MLNRDADYYLELQTKTGWGRTLQSFAEWCAPEAGWLTLDIGCGPGLLPAIFSRLGCKAVGVDLDPKMFKPAPLLANVVVADGFRLPFADRHFDLISATNLLFLLPQPAHLMMEMKRLVKAGGKVAILNPSENLSASAAATFADERGLEGLARQTLINWAIRAENNYRWNEQDTRKLYEQAGMNYGGGVLKVGPGFGRFSWGTI